jgi:hypothetical protein
MKTLKEALGEERWVKIQRSSLKEQIRNVPVSEVTIGEISAMAELFFVPVTLLTQSLYVHMTGYIESKNSQAKDIVDLFVETAKEILEEKVFENFKIVESSNEVLKIPKRD